MRQFLIFLCFSLSVTASAQTLQQGLVAHYPFSGNATDASGNGLDGIVIGATLTTDRFGMPNSAYLFSRQDTTHIEVPHDTLLNVSGSMSLGMWVYKTSYGGPDSSTTVMSVIHKGRDVVNSYGYYTVHHSDRFYLRNMGANAVNTDTVSQLSLNQWHFLVGVNDTADNTLRLYIDGNLLQTRGGINFISNNNYPLVIGRHFVNADGSGGAAFGFDGKIDDVWLYDRALSAAEVMSLYTLTTSNADVPVSRNGFELYPNPTEGAVFLRFRQPLKDETVQVYNSNGQLMHTKVVSPVNDVSNEQRIDLPKLESGYYLVRVGEWSAPLIIRK